MENFMSKLNSLFKISIIFYLLILLCIYYKYFLLKEKYEKSNDNNVLFDYKKQQNDFCKNNKKYFNKMIEDQIILKNVKIQEYSYNMYIYKNYDIVSKTIAKTGKFETPETINIINALLYYKNKKNIINNNDIYMLDIGGNIGWYPSFFGRFGYSIITFEPLETNYYIQYKNYCLINQKSNVVIVNKGIYIEEKTCDHYIQKNNIGNGMIVCNKKKISNKWLDISFKKYKKVTLTKLSNFIPFLSDKNLAFIKLDIEGAEGKALESGIDLISKYHVPFLLIEFSPPYLEEQGTDPHRFIQLFTSNGYYISIIDFLNKRYISETELFKKFSKKCYQINIYLIHKDIIN